MGTTGKDPWGWGKMLAEHKKQYGKRQRSTIGGTHYDITKMSRAESASHAFDEKDHYYGRYYFACVQGA